MKKYCKPELVFLNGGEVSLDVIIGSGESTVNDIYTEFFD